MYGPWLQSFGSNYENACSQFTRRFPLDLVMHAMTLIMRFKVFEACGTFHHQTSGTAMRTPSAVTCATLQYDYGFHEITKLMTKYMHERHLVYYSWIGHGLQGGPTLAFLLWLSEFKTKTSFGFLIKKIRGRFFYFFEKSKNELVRSKMMFLAILEKIDRFPIIAICKRFRNIRAYD